MPYILLVRPLVIFHLGFQFGLKFLLFRVEAPGVIFGSLYQKVFPLHSLHRGQPVLSSSVHAVSQVVAKQSSLHHLLVALVWMTKGGKPGKLKVECR